MTHPPQEQAELAGLAELLPHPGERELPPGRRQLHHDRLMAAIREQPSAARTAPARTRRAWLRPALALSALAVAVGAVAVGAAGGGGDPVAAVPSPAVSAPVASPAGAEPGVTAKVRGYGTVRQLTDTADLVVRGAVVRASGSGPDRRAVYRIDEVLYAAPGSGAAPGGQITVSGSAIEGMSVLEPGQATVLYLAVADPAGPVYATLSGDFGVFDLDAGTATTRSPAMSVSGLRAEDAAARDRRFSTTLEQLRLLARERAGG